MKHETSEHRVRDAQNISQMCLCCGEENRFGLHAQFLNLDDGSLAATFTTIDEHQSYPGRVHGGITATFLDELLGRVMQVKHPEVFGVTVELNTKYHAPVPLGEPLLGIARLEKLTAHFSVTSALLVLQDGTVAAQATARYRRQSVDKIVEGGLAEKDWHPDPRPHPKTIVA
jgi:uncharacterized protein (TIGR00369 family)